VLRALSTFACACTCTDGGQLGPARARGFAPLALLRGASSSIAHQERDRGRSATVLARRRLYVMTTTTNATVAAALRARYLILARSLGSTAQTARGAVRYLRDCARPFRARVTRLEARQRRKEDVAAWRARQDMTSQEREDRRAATDPRFRRRLIRRLRAALRRDLAPSRFLAAPLLPPQYEAACARLRNLGARAVPPLAGGLALILATDRAAWWRRLPAHARCQRRGDWEVVPGWRTGPCDVPAGGYVWADSGAPWRGGAPGRHRKQLEYLPALHRSTIRAVWIAEAGNILVDVLGQRSTLTGPPPAEDERVTVTPDGRALVTRLDRRDGVQWRIARPESVHGCAAAQRLTDPQNWLVTRGAKSYHADDCATARDAVRAAVANWRAQRRTARATARELAAARTRRVCVADGMRAGYCRAGILQWCADRRIRAERAESGVPLGILIRRHSDDPRVTRVCRIVAAAAAAN